MSQNSTNAVPSSRIKFRPVGIILKNQQVNGFVDWAGKGTDDCLRSCRSRKCRVIGRNKHDLFKSLMHAGTHSDVQSSAKKSAQVARIFHES